MSADEIKLIEIRTEFNTFRESTNEKLDKIFEKLKPQFTYPQITAFLLSLVTIGASMMIYVSTIKSDTRNNTTKIMSLEKEDVGLKKVDNRREIEYDAIMIMLANIQKDIETLNAK